MSKGRRRKERRSDLWDLINVTSLHPFYRSYQPMQSIASEIVELHNLRTWTTNKTKNKGRSNYTRKKNPPRLVNLFNYPIENHTNTRSIDK